MSKNILFTCLLIFFSTILGAESHQNSSVDSDFKNAVKGIIRLPKNSKFAVYIAYRYYFKLLKKLKRISSENIVKKRVRIHNFQKFIVIARSYIKYQLNLIQWI